MFYDKFKSLCDQKGVSCNKAALEMGLSNATPTKWKKTGATPDGITLAKVADYFQVSIDSLLSDSSNFIDGIGMTHEKIAPAPEDRRQISDDELKAAFFNGYSDDLTKEEIDALWEDAREYARFKASQKKKEKT